MWQQEKKDTSVVRLVLWLALATTPMAASLLVSEPMLAQSKPETPSFSLPKTVQNGSTLRIDGSSSLGAINQSLKASFEKQFVGTKVEVAANGTNTALKDLLDGKIDIVAMGRGLTPAEKAQGLEQVRLHREKIAIVVGADNPFKGSLTSKQFARIFRGQITNWSQLGAPSGKIRLIDHPNTSETRDTFRAYPAFKTAEFATGANATQLTEDNTAEIIKQLGKDGISYVLANQVSKLKGVRVLQLHQALPDDAKYPFSQPLVYVYKKNPSLTTTDFLGFTLAPQGQQAIEQGRTAEAEAIAVSVSQPTVPPSPTDQTTATAPSPNPTNSVFGEQPFVAAPATTVQNSPIVNKETPLWLLLPVFFITVAGALLWWVLGKRSSLTEKTDNLPEANPQLPNTDDGKLAALNGSADPSVNGVMLEEQAVPHSQEQETPDRIPFNIYAQTQSDLTANATQETTNGTSNLYEGSTSGVANGSENNNLGAAALTNGAALATGIGTATWSTFTNKETETDTIDETVELNNYTQTNTPESDEVAWDIEAPAAVVNTSYPHLTNISEDLSDSDVELPSSDVTAPIPDLPDVPEATSNFGYWDTEVNEYQVDEGLQAELNWLESITSIEDTASIDELPLDESGEVTADVEPSVAQIPSLFDLPELPEDELPLDESDEVTTDVEPSVAQIPSLFDLPELPEDELNVVADAAEPTLDLPEAESPAEPTVEENVAESTDFTGAAVAAGAGMGAWATLASQIDTPVDNEPIAAETAIGLVDADDESSIVLIPQTYTSAHVSWEISEAKKAALRKQGGSQLVVWIYDVTGIDLSYQSPQLVQHYECEETAHDHFVEIPVTDRDYVAEIGYVADGDGWLFIARSPIVRVFSPVNPDPVVDDVAIADKTDIDLLDPQEEIGEEQNSIVLTPRTYQWAEASWEISETKKAELQQQGGSQLVVRLYDVTGIDLSYQSPQFVQQYECDETAHDRFVEIPISDRDYIAEIGYVADGDGWLFIARSAIVRVFSPVPPDSTTDPTVENVALISQAAIGLVDTQEEIVQEEIAQEEIVQEEIAQEEIAQEEIVQEEIAQEESSIVLTPRTPKWAYVSWHISKAQTEELRQQGGSQLVVRLYDVTGIDLSYQSPQLVQQYESEEVARDRFVAIPVSDRDYMVEIGYLADGNGWLLIARSAIIRVFSRPQGDFWFVADAELIIHGATQPNTTVNIGGHNVKIKPDGTFHLRLPFSDGSMDYLISVAADGESTRTIHKKFSQETSES